MFLKKKNNIFNTVAFRLTLWLIVPLTIISFAVFNLKYIGFQTRRLRELDEHLIEWVTVEETRYNKSGVEKLGERVRLKPAKIIAKLFIVILSPESDVLGSSGLIAWKELDFKTAGLTVPKTGGTFRTLPVTGPEQRARIYYKKMYDGNIILIGLSLKRVEKFIQVLKYIKTVLGILICGSVFGFFLIRRAMSGVERVTNTAVRIGKGDLSHRVPVGNDGREIENLSQAFNDMLERIQALITELKEVTNNIAHDLRSPITRIRGIAETTIAGEQNLDEYREMAGMVIEESDRLVGMINTMLEIAEAGSGIADMSNEPVDIAGIVRDVHELFQPAVEDKNINFELDIEEEHLIVTGDKTRLRRIIANLLDNAVKYTSSGGNIRLSVKGTSKYVEISVVDSGTGIEEKDLPHIFERFYRGDRSRTAPGNGLGLSLARVFVRAHGGEITVKSPPGKGSTFTVVFPRSNR